MRRNLRWPRTTIGRLLLVTLAVVLGAGVIAALASVAGKGAYETGNRTDNSSNVTGVPAGIKPMPPTSNGGGATSRSGAPAASSGQPAAANLNVPDPARQIIKSGALTLVAQNIDAVTAQARSITLAHGGLVMQSNTTKQGDSVVADLTIQVPADQFEDTMAALRNMSGVTDRRVDKTTSQDVTEEYVDVKAQIDNLKVTERQLQTLMEKATRMEDVIAIQRELTNVRGQIDRLQGRANYLERRTAMSTITLHIEPPATAGSRPGWRFTEAVSKAWARSVVVFQGFADALITLIAFSIWLLPVLALAWVIWRLATRRNGPPPVATPRSGEF